DCGCFPPTALVQLESGATKRMSDVCIGDRLAIGDGEFGDVYLITHSSKGGGDEHENAASLPYVSIIDESGHRIQLTPNHLLHVNGEMRPAAEVRRLAIQ
ncbi:unnamed protein product, partial [Phaeothamnion confervicola]